MARRRRQPQSGVLTRLGRGVGGVIRWFWDHPQPLLALFVLAGIGWSSWVYVRSAEAFRITRIILPTDTALKVPDSLLGMSLWEVDLRALSERLAKQEPWLKEVRVVRQLPNALRIEPIARIPVAQVRLDQWYPVDQGGFIFPQGSPQDPDGLVHLVGFQQAGAKLTAGRQNDHERLQLGLRVLALLRKAPPAIARHISEVNVADAQQIRLLLDDETEVRCGSEAELLTHLERLRSTLNVLTKQQLSVRYIDVRFPEPVIGPRP